MSSRIALDKSGSMREASHQPAFMGSYLNISQTCLPSLSSKWVSPCLLCPLWANSSSVDVSIGYLAILADRYGIQGQNYVALL